MDGGPGFEVVPLGDAAVEEIEADAGFGFFGAVAAGAVLVEEGGGGGLCGWCQRRCEK